MAERDLASSSQPETHDHKIVAHIHLLVLKEPMPEKVTAVKRTSKKKAPSSRTRGGPSADVIEAILGQFSVKKPWLEPTPPPPRDLDLVVIVAALAAAARTPVVPEYLEAAGSLWKESHRTIELQKLVDKRLEALRKLLFPKGENAVDRDIFLQKLLPRDTKEEREQTLIEALLRIPSIFAERFRRGGEGWPLKAASALLADEYATGVKVRELFEAQAGENGGVTLEMAATYAPMILGWREFSCSPQMRGSQRHNISGKLAAESPQTSAGCASEIEEVKNPIPQIPEVPD